MAARARAFFLLAISLDSYYTVVVAVVGGGVAGVADFGVVGNDLNDHCTLEIYTLVDESHHC